LIDALRYVALNKLAINNRDNKLRSRLPYNPKTTSRSMFDELIGSRF
jgi:phage terminase large subunit